MHPAYEIEEPLQAPAPRPLPRGLVAELKAKRRRSRRLCLALGLACLVLSWLPVVEAWSDTILPLRFLGWIGVAFGVAWLLHYVVKLPYAPYRHFMDGDPLPATVRALRMVPTSVVNGNATHYAYEAVVDIALVDGLEPATVECRCPPFSADHRERYRCSYRVGDTVTALLVPGDEVPDVQLYGFLGLTPGAGVYRDDAGVPANPLNGPLGAALIFLIVVVLFWNIYAIGRYQPLQVDRAMAAVPVGLGAMAGLAVIGWSIRRHRRATRRLAERNRDARDRGEATVEGPASVWGQPGIHGWLVKIALVLGAPLLTGLTAWCWTISANALLDASQPDWRPIEIVEATVTTHAIVFREYKLAYRLPGEGKTRSLLVSPETMAAVSQASAAEAAVRDGALHWPWAAAVRPTPQPASSRAAGRPQGWAGG